MRDEPSWTASAALDLDVVAAVELAVLEEPPEAPVAVAVDPEPAPVAAPDTEEPPEPEPVPVGALPEAVGEA